MILQNKEDLIWEPLETIRDDVPVILEEFIHTVGVRILKKNIIDHYF